MQSNSPQDIQIAWYDYDLPNHRIAQFPLPERDRSNLLVYQGGAISGALFSQIGEHLPEGALLVFNNTRVIHARILFTLPNGSPLEILCLEPLAPVEYQLNFSSSSGVCWKALVGGNRKWKSGRISRSIHTSAGPVTLTAIREERQADAFNIRFEWDNESLAFGELLAQAGIIPLPPYLNRDNVPEDEEWYQTVYARQEGSVAAPTAGLHFTERVLADLEQRGLQQAFVTLHVGAGTFRPVRSEKIGDHHMHEESLFVRRESLQTLHMALQAGRPVIAVGTTSARLLESLYWYGRRLLRSEGAETPDFAIQQWEPYEDKEVNPPAAAAIGAIVQEMDQRDLEQLEGYTQLIIAPGYQFHVLHGLITNFHQPRSTLLLLIAALVGPDWRRIYDYALANEFRFLSYGDSSLLLPGG